MSSLQNQPTTPRLDRVLRWLGAVGITLAPLGLFVIPGLMYPEPFETTAEQARAMAEGTTGGYPGQLVQLVSVVCLMPAALGIGGYTISRGRGRTLGIIALITGMFAAISLLVVMGFELAMLTVLLSATDVEAAVAVVVTLSAGPAFTIGLIMGLVGFFLTLPLLALALWRSRVVPIIVPLLFVLPLLIGFVPLPFDSTVAAGLLLLAPCIWMAVQLIRGVPVTAVTSRVHAEVSDHA